MFKRINCIKIIKDHIHTLRDIGSKKKRMHIPDLFLFFLIPFGMAAMLSYFEISLSSHITDLITAISIIGGFLFNLLAIIYGLMDKITLDIQGESLDKVNRGLKSIFIKEVHINISFNILISFILLILLIFYSYFKDMVLCGEVKAFTNHMLVALIYFLLILFTLTMLMILNRIYILLKKG